MKKLLSLVLLGVSLSGFAGDKGNGGDPYEIWATNFPESQKIQEAIEIAESKLTNSKLPKEFVDETIYEMNFLEKNDRYRYLGNVIVMPGADEGFGYEIPGDEGHFLGLGAFTKNEKGAPVYFTERTLKYDANKFAELLLHEVFHHVLPTFLKVDEGFVESLVQDVWDGEVSSLLLKSLERGYYLPKGEFYKSRVLAAYVMLLKDIDVNLNPDFGVLFNCETALGNRTSIPEDTDCFKKLAEHAVNFPDNIWNMNLWDYMSLEFFEWSILTNPARSFANGFLKDALTRLGYEVYNKLNHCKVPPKGFSLSNKCVEHNQVKDIIRNSNSKGIEYQGNRI